jgi:hypothetical protein
MRRPRSIAVIFREELVHVVVLIAVTGAAVTGEKMKHIDDVSGFTSHFLPSDLHFDIDGRRRRRIRIGDTILEVMED